jgi:hypothetical protein
MEERMGQLVSTFCPARKLSVVGAVESVATNPTPLPFRSLLRLGVLAVAFLPEDRNTFCSCADEVDCNEKRREGRRGPVMEGDRWAFFDSMPSPSPPPVPGPATLLLLELSMVWLAAAARAAPLSAGLPRE